MPRVHTHTRKNILFKRREDTQALENVSGNHTTMLAIVGTFLMHCILLTKATLGDNWIISKQLEQLVK